MNLIKGYKAIFWNWSKRESTVYLILDLYSKAISYRSKVTYMYNTWILLILYCVECFMVIGTEASVEQMLHFPDCLQDMAHTCSTFITFSKVTWGIKRRRHYMGKKDFLHDKNSTTTKWVPCNENLFVNHIAGLMQSCFTAKHILETI